jgi:nitrile hydratase
VSYVSHADLGGRRGFGAVVPEAEGVAFHAAWESRVHALTLALGASGRWNLDMSRSARETLPDYLGRSYYEIWLGGLEKLLIEGRLVAPDELAAGRALHAPEPLDRILGADQVAVVLARGSPTERIAAAPPRYAKGQRVRTMATAVAHHTRLPGYLRGKAGVVERLLGRHVFADSHARGLGEDPRWLYTVVFDAVELWGGEGTPGDSVSFDAWEPYLEAA